VKTLAGALAGVFALLLPGCGAPGSGTADEAPSRQQATPSDYARRLLLETNAARIAEGLPRLDRSRCAEREARRRAGELRGQELEHRPLVDVAKRCAPGGRAAENLVDSAESAADVVQAWMASPGHRNNIVDPALTAVGIGCVRHEDGLVCSQVFLGDE
jgi:uncharacterized protein YkwD